MIGREVVIKSMRPPVHHLGMRFDIGPHHNLVAGSPITKRCVFQDYTNRKPESKLRAIGEFDMNSHFIVLTGSLNTIDHFAAQARERFPAPPLRKLVSRAFSRGTSISVEGVFQTWAMTAYEHLRSNRP